MKTFLKKALIPVIAIIVAVTMAVIYATCFAPKKIDGEKSVLVEIVYQENSFKYDVDTNAETVYELLVELDETYDIGLVCEDSSYGKFIKSLKGVEQNETQGIYYTYEIKGLDFANGISIQTIKDGDIITFKYTKDTYDENWNLVSSELQGKGAVDSYVTYGVVFASVIGVLVALALAYGLAIIIKSKKA
ncbi:MAG: DUF4430 domain-containing protein [Clostridia bacterium]|nr:DUF4430 domain-containing protein [Clostridia bacterium]